MELAHARPVDPALKPQWFYILLALADGDRHGLAIARDVHTLSDGAVHLWPATLYAVFRPGVVSAAIQSAV